MAASSPITVLKSITVDPLPWIHRGLEVLWLLTVLLVPLAFLGPSRAEGSSIIGSFELPKIVLLRTFVGLMAVLWLIEWGVQARVPRADASSGAATAAALVSRPTAALSVLWGWLRANSTRWLILAVAFFIGGTLLSTVLSVSFEVSLWGEVPGQDSYSAYTTIAYVVLFAVIATHLKTPAQLWRLLGAVVLMGVLVAVYAALQHYGHDVFDLMVPPNGARATSTMSNPILVGSVLLMTIPISLMGAAITLRGPIGADGFWWKLGLWSAILAAQVLGLVFTFSRGPWVGTIVALVGFIGLVAAFAHWRVLIRTVMVCWPWHRP